MRLWGVQGFFTAFLDTDGVLRTCGSHQYPLGQAQLEFFDADKFRFTMNQQLPSQFASHTY